MISYPWSTTRNIPKLTEIPPHVVLLSELHTISRQVESFKNDFREVLKTELDARELGGEEFSCAVSYKRVRANKDPNSTNDRESRGRKTSYTAFN